MVMIIPFDDGGHYCGDSNVARVPVVSNCCDSATVWMQMVAHMQGCMLCVVGSGV